MAVETSDRHRTTCRNMRVSVLLILITVGLPGCAGGTGTGRPAAVRLPATNPTPTAPTPSAEPEPKPYPDDRSGYGGAAASAAPGDTAAPDDGDTADDTDAAAGAVRRWPGRRVGPWHRLPAQAGESPDDLPSSDPGTVPSDDRVGRDGTSTGTQRQPDSEEQRAGPPAPAGGPPPGYQRSLAYSGLLGLLISAVGLVMVGTRRRYW